MAQLDHTFEKNQAMQGASFLALEYGFEPGDLGAQGMIKFLDDQHALGVGFDSPTMSRHVAVDRAADWRVSFGFYRRDINEHLVMWLGDERIWFARSTVSCRGDFVTDHRLRWAKDVSFSEHRDEIESAVVRALDMVDLETIETNLYDPAGRRHDLTKCAVNDALNGSNRTWDQYLELHEKLSNEPSDHYRNRHLTFDKNLRKFKTENPDGIPR